MHKLHKGDNWEYSYAKYDCNQVAKGRKKKINESAIMQIYSLVENKFAHTQKKLINKWKTLHTVLCVCVLPSFKPSSHSA